MVGPSVTDDSHREKLAFRNFRKTSDVFSQDFVGLLKVLKGNVPGKFVRGNVIRCHSLPLAASPIIGLLYIFVLHVCLLCTTIVLLYCSCSIMMYHARHVVMRYCSVLVPVVYVHIIRRRPLNFLTVLLYDHSRVVLNYYCRLLHVHQSYSTTKHKLPLDIR